MAGTHRSVRYASCPAYAKINLYLDIKARRADGFHALRTVMHAVSLHDDVTVGFAPGALTTISLRVYGARLPLDSRNLAWRAAVAFLEKAGLSGTVHITLRKKLPIAAGLAGGSSNAAAVLRLLQRLTGTPLTQETLFSVAASLGSDVPFCLAGGTQLCTGRGECMRPLSLGRPLHGVLVTGREHVSTPQAFALCDTYYHDFDGSVPHGAPLPALITALQEGTLPDAATCVYNVFEPVILPTCSHAAAARAALLSCGAYAALMSGSGPAVFGLFASAEEAEAAAHHLGPAARVMTSAPPRA